MDIKLQNDNQLVMVDDSEIDLMLMERYFKKSSLKNEFLPFYSGEEFLQYMEDVRKGTALMPALVLLDINMPCMNGFEVLVEFRKYAEFKLLPVVIFLSNSNDQKDIEKCLSLNTYLQEKFTNTADCVAFLNGLKA